MKPMVKKQLLRRLKIIEGQVRGLQKMINEEMYCIDVITQASAIRRALSVVEDIMLENHLSGHVIHQIKGGEEKKAITEIIEVFKKAKKK